MPSSSSGRTWAEWGRRIVRDEWYRSPDWDAEAQEDFELRLRRARPGNRQQYLNIKALALLDAGHEDDAVRLLHRSIDCGTTAGDTAFGWERLGDLAARHGRIDEAVAFYERVLREQPSLSGTSGSVEISLAEVLIATREEARIEEAITYLDAWITRKGLKLDDALFRWFLAHIDVSEAIGDHVTAARSARSALELAGRGPRLTRQPDVGIVHTDDLTLKRLRRMAGADAG